MIPVPLACLFSFLTMRSLRRRFVVVLKPIVLFFDSRGHHVHTYLNGQSIRRGRNNHTVLLGNETPTVLGIKFKESPHVHRRIKFVMGSGWKKRIIVLVMLRRSQKKFSG